MAGGTPDITPQIHCLFTTVRNISGSTLSFSFLGRHGKRLGPGQLYTVPGTIWESLSYVGRTGGRRKFDALQRALAGFTDQGGNVVAATLAIQSTPAPLLYDATHADLHTKQLILSNNTLGFADPCWGAYASAP